MAKIRYLKQGADTASSLEFDSSVLGKRPKRALLREATLMYAARQRAGTHSTKTRAEVAGSGRKLWRQKGTGRARVGDRRMPHWRGGGVVHGPRPRDYSYAIPKKARVAALRHALLGKITDGEVVVIDPLALESPKTAVVVKTLKQLGLEGTCLLVTPAPDDVLYRSARNIPGVNVLTASEINALDVIKFRNVVMVKDALEVVVRRVTS